MDFKQALNDICLRVSGGIASSLMGFDGIPVETVQLEASGMDINTLLVEYTNIFQQVCRSAEVIDSGQVREMVIRTDAFSIILRRVTEEYFLALMIKPEGNLGQGRYGLRVFSPQFEQELI